MSDAVTTAIADASVVVVPARTPTLAPATHTNCSVIDDDEGVWLVDPATPYADEHARFDEVMGALLRGRRVRGIVLTHHHPDHVGDAARLALLHGASVWAHAETASRIDVPVTHLLDDDDVLPMRAGTWRALHTPGHAPGHVCLWHQETRTLLAGDMVASVGSILIDPRDGDMGLYLRSLERLASLAPRQLVPAHGPVLVDGEARLREQRAHRQRRQDAIERLVMSSDRPLDAASIVRLVYGEDTPAAMWPFAELSVLSMMRFAEQRGVIVVEKHVERAAWRRA